MNDWGMDEKRFTSVWVTQRFVAGILSKCTSQAGKATARLDFQIKKMHVIHTYRYREVLSGCGNLLQFFDDGLFPV